MNRSQAPNRRPLAAMRCSGFSLLELVTATAITAALMISTTSIVRSSYAAWQAHEADLRVTTSADAVLRHIIRRVRQAESIVSVTDPSDTTGRLELLVDEDGDGTAENVFWEHTGTSDGLVVFNSPTVALARGIDQLRFEVFRADSSQTGGISSTSSAGAAQLLRCTVQVTLPRGAGQTRTVSCSGWIRSWDN